MHHHSILCWLDGFYIYRAECGEADTTEVCHGCLFVTYLFIWYSLICPFSLSCRVYLIFWVLDSENIVIQDVVLIILVFIYYDFTHDFLSTVCYQHVRCLRYVWWPKISPHSEWYIYIHTHAYTYTKNQPINVEYLDNAYDSNFFLWKRSQEIKRTIVSINIYLAILPTGIKQFK
jgi:hypothetical protein